MILIALLVLLGAIGCSKESPGSDSAGNSGSSAGTASGEKQASPKYTSWVVSIVDDQEFSEGGMTYTIALNLQATNPTGYRWGTYTGTATAKTTTTGTVGKGTLTAEAIANSTQLEFTLADPEGGEAVASLNPEELTYTGTGTITMQAAGTASVGAASGGFANNSSQPFTITVTGDKVTMGITIDGKPFMFDGTISGRE
jgi:hypothetical protein